MEASALGAPLRLHRTWLSPPLLRLRSDEQLVALVRAGSRDAFRAIHDRYHPRLLAYARQMLSGSPQDAEDALQDVFVRAYHALREDDRPIALRGWLYRVAHNRCIDELRRRSVPAGELAEAARLPGHDPLAAAERREDLERLVADVHRLPAQQRSALLMRELEGLSYAELGQALGVSVAAVKSLLVRARMGLVEAAEARDVGCAQIRRELALARGRGTRASGRTRRHLRDCRDCREYRGRVRRLNRSFAGLVPAGAGPVGLAAKLGIGPGGGAVAGGGVLGGGAAAATTCKVAAVVCSAVVTAGGAVEVQRQLSGHGHVPPARGGHPMAHASRAPASPQLFGPASRPASRPAVPRTRGPARPLEPTSWRQGGLVAAGEPAAAPSPAPALVEPAAEVSPAGGTVAPQDDVAPGEATPLPAEPPPATVDDVVAGARAADTP